ncbi:MAG: alpha-amylase [Anaerolineaceae bacterium]|nr:alpha-amylase [Anaerolineaceae bacterium]
MRKHAWADDAFFYHIYPLGLCGAPLYNDFQSAPAPRLEQLYRWLDPIQRLGATALYLGPLFESSAHGYDTADYFHIDRRLGDRRVLAEFSKELHRRGLRLVLDGVFNHVGRDFWAFRDLLAQGERSAYAGWFQNLDFSRTSPYGDPFAYEGWAGHYDLVKLNLVNPEVCGHLFQAVRMWVEEFEIDGLRLDAADQIVPDFLTELGGICRTLRSDFWLLGEMVFGDYTRLLSQGGLDAVTNYEAYKGLYSSLNDRNYYEIAYTLKRQFGPQGTYRPDELYSFTDNHDVDRVASSLKNPAHLLPLYFLLFSMPGIPSIYYGSEWGLTGCRQPGSDAPLRPALDLERGFSMPHAELAEWIARLAAVRAHCPALRRGEYCELFVASQQFAFLREAPEGSVVAAVNATDSPAVLELRLPWERGVLKDLLRPGDSFEFSGGRVPGLDLPVYSGRILTLAAN